MIDFDNLNESTIEEKIEYFNNYCIHIEGCESTSFSLYINEQGKVYPCSFMEGTKNFWEKEDGYDMINDIKNSHDFLTRVWNGDRFLEFGMEASKCVSCGQGCQYYNV